MECYPPPPLPPKIEEYHLKNSGWKMMIHLFISFWNGPVLGDEFVHFREGNFETCLFFSSKKRTYGIIPPSTRCAIFTDQHFAELLPGGYMTLNLSLKQTKHI